MTVRTTGDVLAAAAAALVDQRDVAEALDRLLTGSADVLGVDAIGVVVREGPSMPLELLATTSHQVEAVELFQLEQDDGPCLQAVRTGRLVVVAAGDDLAQRWGPVGSAILEAGFDTVYAFPMRWEGTTIGALNAFRRTRVPDAEDEPADPAPTPADLMFGQALADLATVMIVKPRSVDPVTIGVQVHQALEGRVVLEQAKGVLAEQHGTGLGRAYAQLRAMATLRDRTITDVARDVLAAAAGPTD